MPAGHPTHLTPRIREQIAAKLRECSSITAAAAVAGITPKTFYNWVNRGENALDSGRVNKTDAPYVEFFHAIKNAEAYAEATLLEAILVGRNNWQASAWWLERRFPRTWAKMDRHEISGPDGKPVQSQTSLGLTDKAADEFCKKVLGIGGDKGDGE